MNVAITIWGDRISPVFDAARTLLVVAVKDGQIMEQKVLTFHALQFDWVEKVLREHAVKVLICGAICERGVERLEGMGIEVKPFLTGRVKKVLRQFAAKDEVNDFVMPGCCVGGCCQRRSDGNNQKGSGKR